MADKDMKLRLIIEAKNEANAALNDFNADLNRTGGAAGKLGGQMSLLGTVAKGLGAALAAEGARRAIEMADAYTLAEGRLRLVTRSSAELTAVQDQLYASAQRTRTEYLSNVESYARLAQNTRDLNLEQDKLLTINETLNKAFIISGATESERSATMIQLTQAFSAGVLRGEEFNSVAEQGSRVMQLLADHTGKSRGELRAMAEDGQLTADVLVEAILTGTGDVNAEFDKMPKTVGQAGTVLKNVLGDLVSDANEATGATQGIAEAIIGVAKAIDQHKDSIFAFFSQFKEATAAAVAGAEMMAEAGAASVDRVVATTISKVPGIKAQIRELEDEIKRVNDSISLRTSRGADTDYEKNQLVGLERQLARQQDLLKSITSSPWITGEAGAKIDIVSAAFGRQTFQMQGVKNESESSMRITAKMRQETLAYIETREQALKKDRDAAMAGAKTAEERSLVEQKYQSERAKLAEKENKAAESAAKKAAQEASRRQKEYQDVLDRLLPLEEAQREYNAALAALDQMDPSHQTERYAAGLAEATRRLEAAQKKAGEYAKAMLDAERATQESALAINGTKIEIAIAQGQLTENEALPFQIDLLRHRLQLQEQVLSEMKKSTPEEITAWNSQAEAIAQTTLQLAQYQRQLRMQDEWEAAKQALKDVADQAQYSGQAIHDAIVGAFDGAADALADFVATGKMEVSSLVESILRDFARIAVQQSITGPLASGLGSVLSGMMGGNAAAGSTVSSNFTYDAIFGSAKGNVFAAPGLAAYTNSIVSRPTFFPFAHGVGLMGEGGPEAILPLTRTRSGNLGVEASGAAPTLVVNVIESAGKGGQQQRREENGVNVLDIFVEQIKGSIAGDITAGRGAIPAAFQNTYGMSRGPGGY